MFEAVDGASFAGSGGTWITVSQRRSVSRVGAVLSTKTTSRPGPQSTCRLSSATRISSLPVPPSISSRAGPPMISSAPKEPESVSSPEPPSSVSLP
jgi:hypothetical protein